MECWYFHTAIASGLVQQQWCCEHVQREQLWPRNARNTAIGSHVGVTIMNHPWLGMVNLPTIYGDLGNGLYQLSIPTSIGIDFFPHIEWCFSMTGRPKESSGTTLLNTLHMVKYFEPANRFKIVHLLFHGSVLVDTMCKALKKPCDLNFGPSTIFGILSHISFIALRLLGSIFFLVKFHKFSHQRHYNAHRHDHSRTWKGTNRTKNVLGF